MTLNLSLIDSEKTIIIKAKSGIQFQIINSQSPDSIYLDKIRINSNDYEILDFHRLGILYQDKTLIRLIPYFGIDFNFKTLADYFEDSFSLTLHRSIIDIHSLSILKYVSSKQFDTPILIKFITIDGFIFYKIQKFSKYLTVRLTPLFLFITSINYPNRIIKDFVNFLDGKIEVTISNFHIFRDLSRKLKLSLCLYFDDIEAHWKRCGFDI